MPTHIHLRPQALHTCGASHLQGIGYITLANRNYQRPRRFVRRQVTSISKRKETLDTKGKTAGVDIAITTNGAHEVIVTPTSTELSIETISIASMYLKNQPGIVADTPPKS